jgi:hypothetical protein
VHAPAALQSLKPMLVARSNSVDSDSEDDLFDPEAFVVATPPTAWVLNCFTCEAASFFGCSAKCLIHSA